MSQAPTNLPTRWSTVWECAPDIMVHMGDRSCRQYIATSDQQKQENNAFKTSPIKGPLCSFDEFKPHCHTQLQAKLDDAVLELGKLISRVSNSSATEVGRKIDIVVQQQTEPNLPNIAGHLHLPPFLVFPMLIK